MATAKQIAANQLNALLSTGPNTTEGKAVARRNALKHGLTGAGVVMPIEEGILVQERTDELCSSLKPLHTYDLFLTEEVALEQLRTERCRRLERARRQKLAEDALEHWDENRMIAAEQLGSQLSKEPALTARLLQRTLQGCDWLLERWRGLGRALERCGDWDDAQSRLALDLLGTPPELRRGGTALDPTTDPDDDAQAARVRVVIAEIERLTRLRDEVLDPRDEAEQRAAFHGEGVETDPELQLLHRYEAACQRRKAAALKQLNKTSAPSQPAHPRSPAPDRPSSSIPTVPAAKPAPCDIFLPPIAGGAPASEAPKAPTWTTNWDQELEEKLAVFRARHF